MAREVSKSAAHDTVYTALFEIIGTCHEQYYGYDPDPKRAGPDVPEEIRRYLELAHVTPADLEKLRDGFGKYGFAEKDCEVLDQDAIRDVARVKALLASGVLAIPVGYRVHGPSWSKLDETGNAGPDGRRLIVHPGMMARFARAGSEQWMSYGEALLACMQSGERFVDGVRSGKWVTQPIGEDEEHGGHAVLLAGYDERGFLVKNSWGTAWGDGGYFRIAYDYHELYAGQGLVIRAARIRNPALSPFETKRRIESGRFRVKLQPRGVGEGAEWLLSTWMLEPRDANFEIVEYVVERAHDGAWNRIALATVRPGPTDARTGAPWSLRGEALARARAAEAVRITARIGDLPLGDPAKGGEPRFLRTLRSAEFAPALDGARDLEPVD